MTRRIVLFLSLLFSFSSIFAQSLDEILRHFSDSDVDIPFETRNKMIYNKGNTLMDYDGYRVKVYDKRAKYLQIVTPTEHIIEIATWKIASKEYLVGLCVTTTGFAKQSTLRFFLPQQSWLEIPVEDYLPECSLEDIFSKKKLDKNYLDIHTLVPDLKVKIQYFLPQSGHDIIVVFTCLDELEKSEFKRIYKYLDGTMLDYVWKKGKFTKGPAYFLVN